MKTFSKFIREVTNTTRKSIPHLGSDTSNNVSPDVFLDLLKFLEDNYNSVVTPDKVNITEKFDGFGIRFGLDSDKKFFIESSRSGPVYDSGTFRNFATNKFGKSNPIAEGYEDIFEKLKNDKGVQNILRKFTDQSGIKIVAEALYLPNKIEEIENGDDSFVVFIATRYKKSKLGDWATFILINALDGNGKELEQNKKAALFSELKQSSTSTTKFETPEISSSDISDIDVSNEVKAVKRFVNMMEKKYSKSINELLSSSSRKRSDLQIKNAVKSQILQFQKDLASKLAGSIMGGKLGDIEGVVFKLADGLMFKVVSDAFKKAKAERNKEYGAG